MRKILFFVISIFLVLLTQAQDPVWALVMSKGTGYSSQIWRKRSFFPEDEIKKGWDDGNRITKISYGNGEWVLVMSKGTGYSQQIWRKRSYFPSDEIKQGWDEKKQITDLSYGDGQWVLVMSEGTGYSGQMWRKRSYFPSDEIKEGWDEGKRITHLTYGNGEWVLVMSNNTGYGAQMWRKRTYFPADEIKEGWDEGKNITSLTYGNGEWVVVMSANTGFSNQMWRTRINFPSQEIKDAWDETKHINFIVYGGEKKTIEKEPLITTTPTVTVPKVEKMEKPPLLTISDVVFVDNNNNKAIDANETSKITFILENNGRGDAKDMQLITSATGTTKGITFSNSQNLSTLKVNDKLSIEIPISSNLNTEDGKITFSFKVEEPNGFGTDEMHIELTTRSYVNPYIEIVDYTITSDRGGMLIRRSAFDLQVLLQNTQHGLAQDIKVELVLPDGVVCLSDNKSLQYSSLQGGEQKSIVYELVVSDRFNKNSIPVQIQLSEKHNKYAKDTIINLELNQKMLAGKIVIQEHENTQQGEITIGTLQRDKTNTSDIEMNIPVNPQNNQNTYALIIANEDYQYADKVRFAKNDGRLFKEYSEKTLGIPSKNIRFYENATLGNFVAGIEWAKNVMRVTKGNVQFIFYYAGHIAPEESTNKPFLMPTDAVPTDNMTSYSLERLYSELTIHQSKLVLVFLDACFSGKTRDDKQLVEGRFVVINPEPIHLPGNNLVVFSATTASQTALPYAENNHGLFTYYLLKKLQMSKGNLTLKEWHDFVKQNVEKTSVIQLNKEQTPQIEASPSLINTWESIKIK
jgi:hypothetical protein